MRVNWYKGNKITEIGEKGPKGEKKTIKKNKGGGTVVIEHKSKGG